MRSSPRRPPGSRWLDSCGGSPPAAGAGRTAPRAPGGRGGHEPAPCGQTLIEAVEARAIGGRGTRLVRRPDRARGLGRPRARTGLARGAGDRGAGPVVALIGFADRALVAEARGRGVGLPRPPVRPGRPGRRPRPPGCRRVAPPDPNEPAHPRRPPRVAAVAGGAVAEPGEGPRIIGRPADGLGLASSFVMASGCGGRSPRCRRSRRTDDGTARDRGSACPSVSTSRRPRSGSSET